MEIDIEFVKTQVAYDPATGHFVWKVSKRGPQKAGNRAGCKTRQGYWRIKINQVYYLAHRLAWAIYYGEQPPIEIDHKNHIRDDNRIDNLLRSTHPLNCINQKNPNVRYEADRGKWLARISVDGRQKNLGRYATKEEAVSAYYAARERHYGEYLRNGV